VAADLKKKTEEAVAKLRQTMSGEDAAAIRTEADALGQLIQQIGTSMYQQPGAGPTPEAGPEAGPTPGGQNGPANDGQGGKGPGGEDVVDGEFKNV